MRRRRRKPLAVQAHAAPSQDRWLISYADFVTLLFAVFVVLFAFTRHSKQAIHTVSSAIHSGFESLSAAPPEPEAKQPAPSVTPQTQTPPAFNTAELSRQLQGVLGDSITKHEIVMQQTPDGLIISLRELGFFNSGEATLLPGAADKLVNTAKILMQHGLEVRVEGHSDDQPIHNATFQSNWELSTARAMSVLSMLVDQAGFPPTKISVAGYGAFRPVAPNTTPEGRRMNRRVDLVVVAARSKEEHLH
jgi:chemotaxis protein MotB